MLLNGVINVLKPTGMTSHDVVYSIRKKFDIQKVGHTGTLDPNVAGVLPITIGKGTKLTSLLTEKVKSYRCVMCFGKRTTTSDSYGQVIETDDIKKYSFDDIRKVCDELTGTIFQVPSMYSAIKINGQKLYNIARKGQIVDIPQREVTINSIKILNYDYNTLTFDIDCSKGTYVRAVVEDIAKKLGTLAYMGYLIRTNSGQFCIDDSKNIEDIKKQDIINIDDIIIDGAKEITLFENQIHRYITGLSITKEYIKNFEKSETNVYKVYDINKNLISISKFVDEKLKNIIMLKE